MFIDSFVLHNIKPKDFYQWTLHLHLTQLLLYATALKLNTTIDKFVSKNNVIRLEKTKKNNIKKEKRFRSSMTVILPAIAFLIIYYAFNAKIDHKAYEIT